MQIETIDQLPSIVPTCYEFQTMAAAMHAQDACSADPANYESQMVSLMSPAGQVLTAQMSDEWAARSALLLDCFEAQVNGAFCALASTVIGLRVLRATSPTLIHTGRLPTQDELFNEYIRCRPGGMQGGVSLGELFELLCDYSARRCSKRLQVELHASHDAGQTLRQLHADLLLASSDQSVILVNFKRRLHGQWTGHWSVLGGVVDVSPRGSMVLVLDVAAHKVGAHWIPLSMLVGCISTVNARGEFRGYLRVLSSLESQISR